MGTDKDVGQADRCDFRLTIEYDPYERLMRYKTLQCFLVVLIMIAVFSSLAPSYASVHRTHMRQAQTLFPENTLAKTTRARVS